MSPKITSAYSDFSQGTSIITNRHLDFAIEGEGFFNVQTKNGEVFTRDGRFTINGEGVLVTSVGGYPVLGEKGPIIIPPDAKFEVMPTGQILAEGNEIDRIKITAFEKEDLGKLENAGGNFFRVPVDKDLTLKKEPVYQLRQGVLEISNVKVVDEMLKMIAIQKMHEANVNVAKARDNMLQRSIEMGVALK
jgi:flagellar basal-body rod protein FlgG